jgi:hypothetical protein
MIWGAGNWTKPDNNNDFSVPETPDPALAAVDNSRTAWIMMCDFMREKVRTPGLASFPELGSERTLAVKKSGSTYKVCGYVDYDAILRERSRRSASGVGGSIPGSWGGGTRWDSISSNSGCIVSKTFFPFSPVAIKTVVCYKIDSALQNQKH